MKEVRLEHSSVATCGSSCSPCSPPANATATCNGSTCGFTCQTGYSTCGSLCVDLKSDGQNCGVCGRSCQGAACTAGLCQPLALASSDVCTIAVLGSRVYWGDGMSSDVFAINTSGGPVTKLYSIYSNVSCLTSIGSSLVFAETMYSAGSAASYSKIYSIDSSEYVSLLGTRYYASVDDIAIADGEIFLADSG